MYNLLHWKSEEDIASIAALIRQNKVILGSSDTVLGLLAEANGKGRLALDHVKQRNEKPYVILAGSTEKVLAMVGSFKSAQMETIARRLMEHFWPGPLTLVLPLRRQSFAKDRAHSEFIEESSALGNAAIRVPNHPGLLKLLAITGPLYSTSANISGQPIPERLVDVDPTIRQAVAAVINGEHEHYPLVPSTIVDCSGDKVRIIREGAISAADLEKIYG